MNKKTLPTNRRENPKPHLFLRNGVYSNFQTMQPPRYLSGYAKGLMDKDKNAG